MKLNRNSQSRAVSEQKLQEDIETKASYAKVVAKNSQKTIIVLPKERNQTVNKTKADIINRVDPINTSVNIGKVKNLRDGGLLLGCDNTDELKQIVQEKL
jgi:flagellar biosynthesis/type III secretory pathway chaperone